MARAIRPIEQSQTACKIFHLAIQICFLIFRHKPLVGENTPISISTVTSSGQVLNGSLKKKFPFETKVEKHLQN